MVWPIPFLINMLTAIKGCFNVYSWGKIDFSNILSSKHRLWVQCTWLDHLLGGSNVIHNLCFGSEIKKNIIVFSTEKKFFFFFFNCKNLFIAWACFHNEKQQNDGY